MDVSLICVAKNEALYLESSIDSIANCVKEVIFIDHYSFDNTLDIAKKCKAKYTNFKIIHLPRNKITFGDARNVAIQNATSKIIFKYDADFILRDKNLLKQYMNEFKNESTISISFQVKNLFHDFDHVEVNNNAGEIYLFRKKCFKFINNGIYPDQLVSIGNGRNIYKDVSLVLHINSVKPLFNIYFRSVMCKFQTSPDKNNYNYFEWLYVKQHGMHPSREAIIQFICKNICRLVHSPLRCHRDISTISEEDLRNLMNYIGPHIRNLFKINFANGTYYYEKAVIVCGENDLLCYPCENFEPKLVKYIGQMYDDGKFDTFK